MKSHLGHIKNSYGLVSLLYILLHKLQHELNVLFSFILSVTVVTAN